MRRQFFRTVLGGFVAALGWKLKPLPILQLPNGTKHTFGGIESMIRSNVWATTSRALNEKDFQDFLDEMYGWKGKPKHVIVSDAWMEAALSEEL